MKADFYGLRKVLSFVFANAFGFYSCIVAAGEIYKHVDKEGKVSYSDSPAPDAEKIELKSPNVTTKKDIRKTWSEWLTYAEPMQISFGEIDLEHAITLISKHAEKEDGVIIKSELEKPRTIRIQFHWVAWAQILQVLSSQQSFQIHYRDNVVTVTELQGNL